MDTSTAFIELIVAAMKDATLEGELTQLKAQIDPDGKGLRHCRIIVIPEKMDRVSPPGAPFGTPHS